jgi:hypothetical protein
MFEVNLHSWLLLRTKKVVADVSDFPKRIIPKGVVARLVLGITARHTRANLIRIQYGPVYICVECLLKLLPTPAFALPGPSSLCLKLTRPCLTSTWLIIPGYMIRLVALLI